MKVYENAQLLSLQTIGGISKIEKVFVIIALR